MHSISDMLTRDAVLNACDTTKVHDTWLVNVEHIVVYSVKPWVATFFAAAPAAASIYTDAKFRNGTYVCTYVCTYVRMYVRPQKISYLEVT